MLKRFLLAAVVAAMFVPAQSFAVDHKGQWALGYWDPSAPIGVRKQFSEKAAFDLGIGFATAKISDDPTTATANDRKTNLQFHVEAGIPLTLVKTERADFFFRPGILWRAVPYYLDNGTSIEKKTASQIDVTGTLGAEWHVTDNLSLSVGHGLRLTSYKPVSTNDLVFAEPKSETNISALDALDVTRIGFHWYFN
ncbi:MAG: hypothetical protein ABI960_07235 [Candidatus Eisenbacteria bacterium]